MSIKVYAKNLTSKQKQSFKILLKYNSLGDKLLFLSPLNQIYGLLYIKKESALMINTKKKKYWRGKFNDLLYEIWRLNFTYLEFKKLLLNGVIPRDKIKEQLIEISIEKRISEIGVQEPKYMEIRAHELQLKVKISDRKTNNGILSFPQKLDGLKKTLTIRELLEGENE